MVLLPSHKALLLASAEPMKEKKNGSPEVKWKPTSSFERGKRPTQQLISGTKPAPIDTAPIDTSLDPESTEEDQTNDEFSDGPAAATSSSPHRRQLLQTLQSRLRSPPFRRTVVSQTSMTSTVAGTERSTQALTDSDDDSMTDAHRKRVRRVDELEAEKRRLSAEASKAARQAKGGEARSERLIIAQEPSVQPKDASEARRQLKYTEFELGEGSGDLDPTTQLAPFLILPREIRLLIYRKVHGPSRVINPISKFISITESQLSVRFGGLLRVSKAVSAEAAMIRYSDNQFDIAPDCHNKPRANRRIISWLKGIGYTNRTSLRHLNLHCELAPGEVLSHLQLERLLLAAGIVDKRDKSGTSYMPGPFYGGIRNLLKEFERNTLLDIAEVVALLEDIPNIRHLALMMPWEHGSVDPPLMSIANINKTYNFCFLKGAMLEYGPVMDALARVGPIDAFHFHGFASTELLRRFAAEMKTRLINVYLDTSPDDERVIRDAHLAGWRSCKNTTPKHLPGDWSTCLIYKRPGYF